MVGFGVFKVTDKEECQQSVLSAIRSGYRLIDTAAVYGNEDAVGDAIREAIATGLCIAIWDFSLTDNEMAQINALDLGYVGEAVKHFNPEFVRGCLGVKIHD